MGEDDDQRQRAWIATLKEIENVPAMTQWRNAVTKLGQLRDPDIQQYFTDRTKDAVALVARESIDAKMLCSKEGCQQCHKEKSKYVAVFLRKAYDRMESHQHALSGRSENWE